MNTYYIKQKIVSIKDNYLIYDENKQPALQVVGNLLSGEFDRFFGNIFSIGHNLHINNLHGEEQFLVKKRRGVIWKNYDVLLKGNICASIHQEKNWVKPKFSISGECGSYTFNGDILAREFTIIKDGVTAATVKKKFISIKDAYELRVYEEDKAELFIAAVVAIDNACHN